MASEMVYEMKCVLDRPGTRLPCVTLPDPRMENDFSPPMPYTSGYSATSKSTDSLKYTSFFTERFTALSCNFAITLHVESIWSIVLKNLGRLWLAYTEV